MPKKIKRMSNKVTIGNTRPKRSKRMKHKGIGNVIKKFLGKKVDNNTYQRNNSKRRVKITIEE